jgi:SAM-dependent methyltransferase
MALFVARGRGQPDRSISIAQYRSRAGIYDAELLPFEPIRGDAIRKLQLRPRQTVIDVGSGTGLSFEPLERAVGRGGRIIAIEHCPEMQAQARERAREHGWRNVELIEEGAAGAPLQGRADAALFHFVHDIVRDPVALAHIMRHLKPGARVVATGLQWASPWLWPTNSFVLLAAMHSVTSFEGLGCPWDKLAAYLDGLEIDTALMGGIYIASGRVKG